MAGAPMVILGHNGEIAWGYTTTDADVEDVSHTQPFGELVYPKIRSLVGKYRNDPFPRSSHASPFR